MPSSWKGVYRDVAVVETDGGADVPAMISERARGVVRIVRHWSRCHAGRHSAGNTAYDRACRTAHALCEHLNLMRHVRDGTARVTLAQIDAQQNAEAQRELIEHYDGYRMDAQPRGWETYLADAATEVQRDESGVLVERETALETIRAVRVTCPTTGRQYALRVPPETETARAGVAWTFGLTADEYRPTMQS